MGCGPSKEHADSRTPSSDSRLDNDDWKQLGLGLLGFLLYGAEAVVDSHWAGKAIVNSIKLIRQNAQDAGAATENCTKLAKLVERVTRVVAKALQSKPDEVKDLLAQELVPMLKKAADLTAAWQRKGSLQKFLSGSRCDDDFRKLHEELRDLFQEAAAACTLVMSDGTTPTETRAPLFTEEEQLAIMDTGGYGSVAASKQSYDRLVQLFQTVYRPRGPNARQKPEEYVIDLLYTYNKQQNKSIKDKLEELAQRICGRWRQLDDRETVLERLSSLLATWEIRLDGRTQIDTFRAAVRGALAPLQEATGELMLPLTPEDTAQELKGED